MSDAVQTETLDRLFLELSQFTQATTKREIDLAAKLAQVKKEREAYIKACDVWIETARQVGEKLQETGARAEKAEQERDELKHDIERHLAIISEHLERAEKAEHILDEAIKDRNRLVICLAAADAEVAKAEQENARLREALAAIRDAPGGGPAKRIAMQALGEP